MDKETSDLSIKRDTCPRCGAVWLNGVLHWATGAKALERDLAGLVCQLVAAPDCINPSRYEYGGDTWGARMADYSFVNKVIDEELEKPKHPPEEAV